MRCVCIISIDRAMTGWPMKTSVSVRLNMYKKADVCVCVCVSLTRIDRANRPTHEDTPMLIMACVACACVASFLAPTALID